MIGCECCCGEGSHRGGYGKLGVASQWSMKPNSILMVVETTSLPGSDGASCCYALSGLAGDGLVGAARFKSRG